MIEDLKTIKDKFIENLKLVDQIVSIGTDIGNLVVEMLENLKKQYEIMPTFLEYKNKLNTTINTIRNIKDHVSLVEKYQIIYNQALVLIVENFESFLNDLNKLIIDKYPHLINWPDAKKKLSVDVNLLRYSNPTVGDLVLTSLKGEVNFQDLQSTLRFLKDYLKIDITLDDTEKSSIILGQALRNIIIHNNSRVDHGFLNQIRDIKGCSYKDKDEIKIEYNKFLSLKEAFISFSNKIVEKLSNT